MMARPRALMVAADGEMRKRAEDVGALGKSLQVVDRLVRQDFGLTPRPLGAQQADEGLLARLLVLAEALSDLLLFAFGIEQVVGDLEGEAEAACIAAEA